MSFLRDCIRNVAKSSDDPPPPIDPATLSEEDFDEAVDLLFDRQFAFAARDLLRRAGARSQGSMLRALREGKLLTKAGAPMQMYPSPLQIVGQALLEMGCGNWLDSIRPHVLSEDTSLSKACVHFLGCLAGRSDIDLIRQVLASPRKGKLCVPGETMALSLHHRLKLEPQDATELLPLFDDLWAFTLREERNRPSAELVLLLLNREEAIRRVRDQLLDQPERANRSMLNWLDALAKAHVRLDKSEVERLFDWASELEGGEQDHHIDRLRGFMLLLGALARSPVIRKSIDARLGRDDEDISQYALRSHALWHDIDFWNPPVAWKIKDVPEPVQHYRLYESLSGQISNGGICQYFSNATGDDARVALDALAAIGDEVGRTILLDAMRAFGAAGPSPYRQERNRQLDALLPSDEDSDQHGASTLFAGIDNRWYEHSNKGRRLLLEYMIRHATYFRFED